MGEFVDLDICLDIVMHTRSQDVLHYTSSRPGESPFDSPTESGGRHPVVSPNQWRSFFLENLADDSRPET